MRNINQEVDLFNPKDHELIELYLKPKISGSPLEAGRKFIQVLEIYREDSDGHPQKYAERLGQFVWKGRKNRECYFFTKRKKKHPTRVLLNRESGINGSYWTVFTGSNKEINDATSKKIIIGSKKILAYMDNDATAAELNPNKNGTWYMDEYTLKDNRTSEMDQKKRNIDTDADKYVLCRVYYHTKNSDVVNKLKAIAIAKFKRKKPIINNTTDVQYYPPIFQEEEVMIIENFLQPPAALHNNGRMFAYNEFDFAAYDKNESPDDNQMQKLMNTATFPHPPAEVYTNGRFFAYNDPSISQEKEVEVMIVDSLSLNNGRMFADNEFDFAADNDPPIPFQTFEQFDQTFENSLVYFFN